MIPLIFFFSEKRRMVRASPTNRSRMRSATRRPFWGLIRTKRAAAWAMMFCVVHVTSPL